MCLGSRCCASHVNHYRFAGTCAPAPQRRFLTQLGSVSLRDRRRCSWGPTWAGSPPSGGETWSRRHGGMASILFSFSRFFLPLMFLTVAISNAMRCACDVASTSCHAALSARRARGKLSGWTLTCPKQQPCGGGRAVFSFRAPARVRRSAVGRSPYGNHVASKEPARGAACTKGKAGVCFCRPSGGSGPSEKSKNKNREKYCASAEHEVTETLFAGRDRPRIQGPGLSGAGPCWALGCETPPKSG